jgi:hypothetical protein
MSNEKLQCNYYYFMCLSYEFVNGFGCFLAKVVHWEEVSLKEEEDQGKFLNKFYLWSHLKWKWIIGGDSKYITKGSIRKTTIITTKIKAWWRGSCGRAPAQQAWGPEFNAIQIWYIVRTFVNVTLYPQYNNNKK